jgi:hypothetical protein
MSWTNRSSNPKVHNDYGTHLAFYSVSGRVPGARWPEVKQPGSEVITHILILRSYVCLYRVDRPLLPSPSTGKTNLSGTFLRAVALRPYLVFV